MRLSAYKRINTMILEHPVCQYVCSFSTDLKFSMQYRNKYKLSIHLFIPEFSIKTKLYSNCVCGEKLKCRVKLSVTYKVYMHEIFFK
jgi:hypothetical protein